MKKKLVATDSCPNCDNTDYEHIKYSDTGKYLYALCKKCNKQYFKHVFAN